MNIVKKTPAWEIMFKKKGSLLITDEKTLDNIIEDPKKPLLENDERGFSQEKVALYDNKTSLVDVCREAKEEGADELSVSYDFFFGGTDRENYPDSEKTIKAFKIIHDVAKEYGLTFCASIVSPLDTGGGYVKKHDNTGYTYQFTEGMIKDNGTYELQVNLQTQWLNNKGPVYLKLEKVKMFAFNEERIEDTSLFYVNENDICDISDSVNYSINEDSIEVSFNGYGTGDMKVFGKTSKGKEYNRCIAIMEYKMPELDYFSENALDYMKSIIDLHHSAGIDYSGFYSDEMHIQFDWDLFNHFGETEINTRYVSKGLINEYAKRYGKKYEDFAKYFIYFSYHQHGFLDGKRGREPAQHVFGKDEKSINETFLFRKRYFEMLQRKVVDLCVETKEYAQNLYGHNILTKAHSTWQESPTCDRFYKEAEFSKEQRSDVSRYDYTPEYYWSSSIRENTAACYDYFKWNDFLTGGGTDHPEGGFADRNYYSQAFVSSLGILNKTPIAYNGNWGSPKEVIRRIRNVATCYGNLRGFDSSNAISHNVVQGIRSCKSDVLVFYPLDLNYLEERFGSWMVQYGYCNYITEDKILSEKKEIKDGIINIRGREYRTMVIMFSPLIKDKTLNVISDFIKSGGKVLWMAMPPLDTLSENNILGQWKDLFGIEKIEEAYKENYMADSNVVFENKFSKIADMKIPTNLLPDRIYPLIPSKDSEAVCRVGDKKVGVYKMHENGGESVYLGFRARDDQSASTKKDVDVLFSVLNMINGYDEKSLEVKSRKTNSRYLYTEFLNGSVSITNHYRLFYEKWDGKYFRDQKKDEEALEGRKLPPIEISLDKEEILGREITYNGLDVLTYNIDGKGVLRGFAGKNTKGIRIDDKEFMFCDSPKDISFGKVENKYLSNDIKEMYMIKIDNIGEVRIPIPVADLSEFTCYYSQNTVYEMDKILEFDYKDNILLLDIANEVKGSYIALCK